MGESYTLSLCLLDFVPNLAFLIGAYFLVRLMRLVGNPTSVLTMVSGSALVFLGGTLKALWKLLYTTGARDLWLLSELQFVLLAPGFLQMLVSVILMTRQTWIRRKVRLAAIAPWKIPLLATMTLCSLGLQGILSYVAFRHKVYLAGALYGVAILCMLSMAGMASGEQSVARQWVEESVNSLGQITFALGSWLLYRRFKFDQSLVSVVT